jgi:hypothetical protein
LTHNPVIFTAGGISGLGLDQFSDNDRFSAVVKYLINFDSFKEVPQNILRKNRSYTTAINLFVIDRW